jgi:rRNA maturation RNase YbeY
MFVARSPRVRLLNRQRRLKVDTPVIKELALRVLEGEGADPRCQVEVVLLRDTPMAQLNRRYRQRAGPTDVLSFPIDPDAWPPDEPPLLGTVVVSTDRAADQAAARGHAPADEIRRLVAHGLLHLLGYRDDAPRDRARMRRRENRYLSHPTERR